MENIALTMSLTFALGYVIALVMQCVVPGARRTRVSVLVLLFGVFLVFFKGEPVGEDWIWLGIGFAFFWPWYLAFVAGGVAQKLWCKAFRPSHD